MGIAAIAERMGIVNYVLLPPTAGDVAQVADLPANVAAAFGINTDSERVSRREALSIPAMRRGLQVYAGTICTFPLQAVRIAAGEDGRTAPTLPDRQLVRRSLLEQPDPNLTVSKWLMRLIVDLVLEPFAWCRITRRDAFGFPLELSHLRQDLGWLHIDAHHQTVTYRGQDVPLRDVVRFDSPLDNGALVDGATALRTALKLEATVRRYAEQPLPMGVLSDPSQATPSGRNKMDDTQVDSLLNKWQAGASKWVVRWIGRLKFDAIQFNAEQIQLVQARQRSDVAIAQLINLASTQVNAPSESGMTYNNVESIAAGLLGVLKPYMLAVTQRLSMADITPRGQQVQFDTTAFVRGTTTEVIAAAVAAVTGRIMTVDEARALLLFLPPLDLEDDPEQEADRAA